MWKKGWGLSQERSSRLLLSLLLCMGLLWPMLWALGIESAFLLSTGVAGGVVALLVLQGVGRKFRIVALALMGALVLVQFFLPRAGFFGNSFEALKAVSLYFNDVPAATPLFSSEIAVMLAVVIAVAAYSFTARGVGFLPATVLVIMVLFALWSLGKHTFLWYCAPALAALLLLVAQSSHEKANLFQVLPMAALLVALGLLLTPAQKTVFEPLHKAAMDLKQTISDYLFFTEPRNVFTLGSYGYYPMGNSRLGGPAEPTDYPVMTVKTDEKTLLRGVVKDEYTGRSWRDTSSGRRYLYVNPRWSGLRKSVFLENLPPESVLKAGPELNQKAISVQIQNNVASTVFTPVFLRSVTTYGSMVPYFNEASELFITRDLESGDRYTVYAPVEEGGDAALGALINAAPKKDDSYEKAQQQYLKLPEHMEQRVYEDARKITANASTPYDKACAILRHLQRYYRYSLTPENPPENQDFVTYFLYVSKAGYCTYFASAMTVLCRMVDLPARYVEGFLAQPDSSGFAYVTGKSAHAWTEVYFEGFGWVPFDPTPVQQNLDKEKNDPQSEPSPSPTPSPSPQPPQEQPDDQPTPSPENPEQSNQPQEEEQDPPPTPPEEPPSPWLWLVLLLAAALGGVALRMALCTPRQAVKKQKNVQDQLFVYGGACYLVLKLLKRTPRNGETPLLFARRMDKQRAFAVPLLPLWRLLALSNYSRMKPAAPQVEKARETFLAIYQPQSLWLKLRFRLYTAFTKEPYRCLETALVHQEPESLYGRYKPGAASRSEGKKAHSKKARASKAAEPKEKIVAPGKEKEPTQRAPKGKPQAPGKRRAK